MLGKRPLNTRNVTRRHADIHKNLIRSERLRKTARRLGILLPMAIRERPVGDTSHKPPISVLLRGLPQAQPSIRATSMQDQTLSLQQIIRLQRRLDPTNTSISLIVIKTTTAQIEPTGLVCAHDNARRTRLAGVHELAPQGRSYHRMRRRECRARERAADHRAHLSGFRRTEANHFVCCRSRH